jgi:glycerol-3-phosphate dehydrogenase
VLRSGFGRAGPSKLRLVKGSHIIVPRLYDGEQAYILQNPDRRIVFVIPFEQRFTLIGTTDEFFDGDPGQVAISATETIYLCEAASRFLKESVRPEQVVWSYAGVRPLYDDAAADPSTMTRDYAFDVAAGEGQPPLLSVFGGKITTYRRLAEHVLAKLQPFLSRLGGSWTAGAPLPGGDIPDGDFEAFYDRLCRRRPWLPPSLGRRLARSYGTRAEALLGRAASLQDLGRDLGAGLTEREVEYLVREEWARTAEDILWRRSKLGLRGGPALAASLTDYLARVSADPVG